ncbi:MAG: site-specific DNA-methyltransferase [Phycisphaeraceae bacterium]|nr:site-specific DNA-methyltransferase [Phycisphaeraceae bacterium]
MSKRKRRSVVPSRTNKKIDSHLPSAGKGSDYVLCCADALRSLRKLPRLPMLDLVVTSPPYNIGKSYEKKMGLGAYLDFHGEVIEEIVQRLKPTGSLCWQVGNYVENGYIEPLDILLHPIFRNHKLILRNRIVWHFGHGLHCKRRFSGRYEVVLWYTKSDDYTFNLDAIRVPSKYPGKRSYRGPNAGKLSSHPDGKNPEDVWSIPNVKGRHKEKTVHPCQFPVGLVERLVLAFTDPGDLVLDPFCGVGSAGVAAALHKRRFWGSDLSAAYIRVARSRVRAALEGRAVYRPHDQVLYDHTKSSLSRRPVE